jgi:hypothetical protein
MKGEGRLTKRQYLRIAERLHSISSYEVDVLSGLCFQVLADHPLEIWRDELLELFKPKEMKTFWWDKQDKDSRVIALCFMAAMADD